VTASYGGLSPILPGRAGDPSLIPARQRLTDVLEKLAASRSYADNHATQNQIILKWLQNSNILVVTTSSKESRIKEYVATESLPDLNKGEMDEINAAIEGVHFRSFVSRA